ncbi:MAG: hypothetical protein LBK60_00225 [Verrucomicrobiales bacterium]|jgi:3-phosphoglycerate kinase|nr:hypothetical protein [Verrucomicrobiales bacterium]
MTVESRKKLKVVLSGTAESDLLSWEGGVGVFEADGEFNDGTVTLQRSVDGGTTWTDMGEHTTLTASGGGRFVASNATKLRVTAGGTGPVAVVLYHL